jgi:hypothetical protein
MARAWVAVVTGAIGASASACVEAEGSGGDEWREHATSHALATAARHATRRS